MTDKVKKYEIIYADPAWSFGDKIRSSKKSNNKLTYRDLAFHYDTMSTTEIALLPVKEMLADNAVCFMWSTDAHLPDAIKVMKAWGFKYKTIAFIWNKKTSTGKQVCFMGKWTMKGSEICLLGTKGKAHNMIQSHKVRQLVESKRGRHSEKPDEVRKRIVELLGNRPRVELFAREKVKGWHAMGFGVDGKLFALPEPENGLSKPVSLFYKKLVTELKKTGANNFGAKEIPLWIKVSPATISRYLKELESAGYIIKTSSSRLDGFQYRIEK